ncbi:hypothetical protein [Leptospira kmetyi]|uniref:Lipoprotein n=1 Tax=Leptospira kmetyi TaxID=408139 RepID=A0AAD0URJ1_9LEPT|nr:hypothetical protein [Leptospira kmetyi]AYV56659.1 hypothetical protein EFP84_14920 [Leptospira kmetyi]PJZ31260.1 hypothetical protein CH378_03420 [Leptospira kmetyi]PJZ40216.1 hypothetical protein CH370_17020 [Leptospira kmetyi]
MKVFTRLILAMVVGLFAVNCGVQVVSNDVVRTSKGFYRFFKTSQDNFYNSRAEFCAIDAKTNAITCKEVSINYGF